MKKTFKLRPDEIGEPIYWLHLLILSVVVLGILQIAYVGNMFNIWNIVLSVPLLGLGDVISHSILRIN